jgi:hypothetical protein
MTALAGDTLLLLLQIAAQHPSYFIHFLQLTGPEAELQAAAPAAGGLMNQQQQQLGLSTDDSSDGAFLQMLRSMPACDNITYDSFVAGACELCLRPVSRKPAFCCCWGRAKACCTHTEHVCPALLLRARRL